MLVLRHEIPVKMHFYKRNKWTIHDPVLKTRKLNVRTASEFALYTILSDKKKPEFILAMELDSWTEDKQEKE